MGTNHSLEKILSAGWMIEFYPKNSEGYGAYAWKPKLKSIFVVDEYSPANALKRLEEKIFDEV